MTAVFKRGPRNEPGTWRPVNDPSGEVKASITCPKCGQAAAIDHSIAADGAVTPSLVCPRDGCDFHEMGKLEGWPP